MDKGTWNLFPVALQVMKQVQENSFISQILSDQIWRCNIKQSLSYFKNCMWKFMQANAWHDKLFHFHLSVCISKVWKGREKITKVWISGEQKEIFWWNKNTFHSFGSAIIWWKNKKLMENSGGFRNQGAAYGIKNPVKYLRWSLLQI